MCRRRCRPPGAQRPLWPPRRGTSAHRADRGVQPGEHHAGRTHVQHPPGPALSAQRAPLGEIGLVTIGFTATSAYTLLGSVVSAAKAELPEVELVLREMVTSAQLDALLSGGIDIGMIRPAATGADIITRQLFVESMLAALPSGHVLARRELDPGLADFDYEQFIGYSPSEARYFHELLVGAFRGAGIRPRYAQYVSQVHTMLAMVKADLGVALVTIRRSGRCCR